MMPRPESRSGPRLIPGLVDATLVGLNGGESSPLLRCQTSHTVGKSRLFHEFTRSHRTQGWLILESGSVS